MSLSDTKGVALLSKLLDLTATKNKVIANNIANVIHLDLKNLMFHSKKSY